MRLSRGFLLALIIIGCGGIKDPRRLKFPELREVLPPQYAREELSNGMVCYLLAERGLPLIGFRAIIHTGSIFDPPDRTGLAEILFDVMHSEIEEELERLGAELEAGVERDMGWIEGSCHSEDLDRVFKIFTEILRQPVIERSKLELARTQKKGEILRRDDELGEIARREFPMLVYGRDSPYARPPELETIERIEPEDLIDFHKRYFHPGNIILGIWGDFESGDMIKKLSDHFADWESKRVEPLKKPGIRYGRSPSISLIIKYGVNQSAIWLGHLGIKYSDPKYPEALVMGRVLGGGWYSRFYRHLREEKGLAYSIWASHLPEYDYPGLFVASCQTGSERTCEAISLMIEEIKRISEEMVTFEELETAKDGILNSYPFWFDTPDEIIARLMRYEYYGYPPDFLERLRSGVEGVKRNDLLEVARNHLHPDSLTILVIGDPSKFDQPLSIFGTLDTIRIIER